MQKVLSRTLSQKLLHNSKADANQREHMRFILALANADSANSVPQIVQRDGGAFALGNAQALAIDDQGWMDVAWPGEFPHPNGYLQIVEPEDLDVMLANFNAVKADKGPKWAGIGLYLGHPELNGTAAYAPSYGWFKSARIANGMLQFQLDPDAEANDLIAKKKYKFTSNYWVGSFDANKNFHPFWIATIGLTNNPVIEGKPLANAEAGDATATEQTAAEADPAPAAANAPVQVSLQDLLAGGDDPEWWQEFIGNLQALIDGATDAESAKKLLSAKLRALYEAENQLQQLRGLICQVFPPAVDGTCACPCPMNMEEMPKFNVALTAVAGNAAAIMSLAKALEVKPGEGGLIAHDTLLAAANAAVTAAAAGTALATEFSRFVVEQAIVRGSVDGSKPETVAAANAIVNVDRNAALQLWFRSAAPSQTQPASPGRRPPSAVARAIANSAITAGDRRLQPPPDPLKGIRLVEGAVGNAAGSDPDERQKLVVAAANAHMEKTKCSWGDANAWAWNELAAGRLQAGTVVIEK